MKKRILATLLSTVLMLQVFCFTALADDITAVITPDYAAGEVAVSAGGFAGGSQVSLIAYIGEKEIANIDYLNQYEADEAGLLNETYPTSKDWGIGDYITVLLNGNEFGAYARPVDPKIVADKDTKTIAVSVANLIPGSEAVIAATLNGVPDMKAPVSADVDENGFVYFSWTNDFFKQNDVVDVVVTFAEVSGETEVKLAATLGDFAELVYAETEVKISTVSNLTVKVGASGKITAAVEPSNTTLTWESSNAKVLKIAPKDNVCNYVGVSAGVCTLNVSAVTGYDAELGEATYVTHVITVRVNP